MEQLLQNKKLLVSLTALCAVTILIIGLAVINLQQPGTKQSLQSPSPTPNVGPFFKRGQNNQANEINISPSTAHVLKPGTKESFIISLPSSLSLEDLSITLTIKDLRTDSSSVSVPITISNQKKGELKIIMKNNVVAFGEYKITLKNKNSVELIEATYLSDTVEHEEKNTQELSQYLPHETSSYRLIYIQKRNVYIFNFKINDTSKISPQQQFENAKDDATKYIKSKGIDTNTITIEWRFS